MTSLRDCVFYSNNATWPRSREIGYKAGDFQIDPKFPLRNCPSPSLLWIYELVVPRLGTPCTSSGVNGTFMCFTEDSLLSPSNPAPTQGQPDVYLLAGAGVFAGVSYWPKRTKTLNKRALEFPKEMAQSFIIAVNEPLS